MGEIRESLIKNQRELEELENADVPQREIDKVKAKLRSLEAEHIKTSDKYFKRAFRQNKINRIWRKILTCSKISKKKI